MTVEGKGKDGLPKTDTVYFWDATETTFARGKEAVFERNLIVAQPANLIIGHRGAGKKQAWNVEQVLSCMCRAILLIQGCTDCAQQYGCKGSDPVHVPLLDWETGTSQTYADLADEITRTTRLNVPCSCLQWSPTSCQSGPAMSPMQAPMPMSMLNSSARTIPRAQWPFVRLQLARNPSSSAELWMNFDVRALMSER